MQANYFLGNISVTNSANLGAVGNIVITGGTNGYFLQTDGTGNLSWASQGGGASTISNGNSNVNIPTANGNINFSSAGNANVAVITGTGVNVSGTLNIVGQTNLGAVGNVVITGGANGYVLSTDGAGTLSWIAASTAGSNIVIDTFTGNGVQTVFTLTNAPTSEDYTIINIDGVSQLHSAYTVAGSTLTLSSAPANGAAIEVMIFNLGSGGGSALTIQNEGSNLTTTASLINFVGNGITANATGNSVTVTVPGGATGGGSDQVFQVNDQTVTANYTIASGKSASSVGPITINSGVVITLASGSRWVIL